MGGTEGRWEEERMGRCTGGRPEGQVAVLGGRKDARTDGRPATWKDIHAWGGSGGSRRARAGGRMDSRPAEGWEDEGEEGSQPAAWGTDGRTDGGTDEASPQLPFEKDCGADNVCVDDLRISFDFSG